MDTKVTDTTIKIATFFLDDDPEALDLIKKTIDEAGITDYKLFTDEDVFIEGLTESVHVCVIDHLLSKKTGLDILKEIKAKNDFSYVIAYTGYTKNPEVLIDYINAKINAFVDKNKPNHLEQLTQFLKEGLRVAERNLEFYADFKKKMQKIEKKEMDSVTS
jgi:DNA-binding NtrC family response regulator